MKTFDIQPIETRYKGYNFRSRTEARWAVYFDSIGIEWEYEKEGYTLRDGTRYLPDFWLPKFKKWAEVKGDTFNNEEIKKCFLLHELLGYGVILLNGTPNYSIYKYTNINIYQQIELFINLISIKNTGSIREYNANKIDFINNTMKIKNEKDIKIYLEYNYEMCLLKDFKDRGNLYAPRYDFGTLVRGGANFDEDMIVDSSYPIEWYVENFTDIVKAIETSRAIRF